jgi:hypothetical protein
LLKDEREIKEKAEERRDGILKGDHAMYNKDNIEK